MKYIIELIEVPLRQRDRIVHIHFCNFTGLKQFSVIVNTIATVLFGIIEGLIGLSKHSRRIRFFSKQ